MNDDRREPAQNPQTDAHRDEVAMTLGDQPGLFRLPKCSRAVLVPRTPDRADLQLELESGHRILVEMDSKTAESLLALLEIAFKRARGD